MAMFSGGGDPFFESAVKDAARAIEDGLRVRRDEEGQSHGVVDGLYEIAAAIDRLTAAIERQSSTGGDVSG